MQPTRNLASEFFRNAQTHPERVALALEETDITYGDLARQALRLSQLLPREPSAAYCGILAQRSEAAFAGVLACLAAGYAYVPLNPAFPAGRNRYIVDKADLSTLIVGAECADALRRLLATDERPYCVLTTAEDPQLAALLQEFPGRVEWRYPTPKHEATTLASPCAVERDAAAYVLFTSGSTGQPKGVIVRHRNVTRYVDNLLSVYPILEGDRVSQTFDLTFDLSVHDMFVTWAVGATLVVYPTAALAAPVPYTQKQRVNVWFSVPSLAALIDSMRQAEPGSLSQLRLSFFCGEKLSWNTFRAWKTLAPASRIVNLYGPTETTIAITHFEVPADLSDSQCHRGVVPIGRPLPGQGVELTTQDATPAAPSQTGELWLWGDQLSGGYLGEPQLTSERFVTVGNRSLYRTGDLAQLGADGVLQFVGRDDGQVKIMGYRVELGEVEHALLQASGAPHAVADVTTRDGITELYAVLPAACAQDKRRIRETLKATLPSYMVPRRFVFIDSFPHNASGKLDRKQLREQLRHAQEQDSNS